MPPGHAHPPAHRVRRRRGWAFAVCAVVVVLVAAAVVVLLTRSSNRTPAPAGQAGEQPYGSGPGAPTLAEARSLLYRHGTALLQRNGDGFLADIDTAASATSYLVRQRDMFANLAAVPLSGWSYTVSAPVTTGDAVQAAAKRYGAPTLLVRAQVTYRLRDVDPTAATHDVWLSFVSRGGRVLLAGDDDVASSGGASWRGLWDFGPVRVYRGTHSLVLAHDQNASAMAGLAALVDASVPVVTSVWGSDWAQVGVVLLPDSTTELDDLVGQQLDLTKLAALSVAESEPVADAEPQQLVQRVIMNPAKLRSLSDLGRRVVVQHEVAHLAARPVTGQAEPAWLVEGFAEYVGNLDSGQPTTAAAAELAKEVQAGQVPQALPSATELASTSPRAAQAYEEAWLACRLVASLGGQDGLVRLYREVGGSQASSDQAVAQGLQDVVHLTTDAFTARWRDYVRAQLG